MKKEYTIKKVTETKWIYTFIEPNEIGEKIVIEITKCLNLGGKNSIPYLWKKHGYMDRVLESYWYINTCVRDTEGNYFQKYNPQLKKENNQLVIDFDWIFEAIEGNKQKLIDEVFRLASTKRGRTATEQKLDEIKNFGEKNNIDIYKDLPKGWDIIQGATTAPYGTMWIYNRESIKSKKRKTGLLLESKYHLYV